MSAFSESEFVDAAACGDLEGVRSLLQSTEPLLTPEIINKVDKDGKSAFHYACLNDDANLLRILLADFRVDVLLTSKHGDTGMHMSALYAALEAISLLSADGRIDINSQNKYGETPLHLCAGSGDKAAAKTALVLLQHGASLSRPDKWGRGPLDVSHDNAENPIVATFTEYLNDRSRCTEEEYTRVVALSAAHKEETDSTSARSNAAAATRALFGGGGLTLGALGGVTLKKTNTVLKTMFKAGEGQVSQHAATRAVDTDGRRALSKLIDFPGDLEEIRRQLENVEGINPEGADAYGLTALHKFASWNKTEFMDLLIPRLSPSGLETKCPAGKTALHYAVEMAAVAAVKTLVAAGADVESRDGKGATVREILDAADNSGIIERLRKALVKE